MLDSGQPACSGGLWPDFWSRLRGCICVTICATTCLHVSRHIGMAAACARVGPAATLIEAQPHTLTAAYCRMPAHPRWRPCSTLVPDECCASVCVLFLLPRLRELHGFRALGEGSAWLTGEPWLDARVCAR